MYAPFSFPLQLCQYIKKETLYGLVVTESCFQFLILYLIKFFETFFFLLQLLSVYFWHQCFILQDFTKELFKSNLWLLPHENITSALIEMKNVLKNFLQQYYVKLRPLLSCKWYFQFQFQYFCQYTFYQRRNKIFM